MNVNVHDNYVPGRPLRPFTEIYDGPPKMKRLYDWYMRASAANIDSIRARIPSLAFLVGQALLPLTLRTFTSCSFTKDSRLAHNIVVPVSCTCLHVLRRMQYEDQELRYLDPRVAEKERCRYINLMRIYESKHT